MNTLKSLLLGSAAALVVATGAQAASAPSSFDKYTPTIDCPTGFWNTTGTDVCLRVSGFVRAEIAYFSEDYFNVAYFPSGTFPSGGGIGTNQPGRSGQEFDHSRWGTTAQFQFDARRQTDLGLLRTYMEFRVSDRGGADTGPAPGLRVAFIQLGNWVFGKAVSAFNHGASAPNGGSIAHTGYTSRVTQVRYTYTIGNGMMLALALEDPHHEEGRSTNTVSNGTLAAGALPAAALQRTSGRNDTPSFVASLNYAAGPLNVQVGGVLVDANYRVAQSAALTPAQIAEFEDGAGFGVMFGAAYEATEQLNIGGRIHYTDNAHEYNLDWVNLGWDHSSILAMEGFISYLPTPDITLQIAGGWGTVDNDLTSATQRALNNAIGGATLNTAANLGASTEGEIWVLSGLAAYRPVDGVEFLLEASYLEADASLTWWNRNQASSGQELNDFRIGLDVSAQLN